MILLCIERHTLIVAILTCRKSDGYTLSRHVRREVPFLRMGLQLHGGTASYIISAASEGLAVKIAVCAWGSLIWDPRDLLIRDSFGPLGPVLPLEFSRISGGAGRLRRLTLAIDPQDGVPCRTHVAESAFEHLPDAVENLRLREGMWSGADVGMLDRHSESLSALAAARHPKAILAMNDWLAASNYDAVIWTALPPNFAARSESGADLSVKEAIEFLEALAPNDLAAALTYVRIVPEEVQTPIRTAVNDRWPPPDTGSVLHSPQSFPSA
jgi:hypothetical protein